MDRQCTATNKDGHPCSATPGPSGWCRWHDPALTAQRRQWKADGGRARANDRRARKELLGERLTPQELEGVLSRGLRRVEAGNIEPGVLSAMASAARAIVAVRQAGEVEERLAELEARAGITVGRTG